MEERRNKKRFRSECNFINYIFQKICLYLLCVFFLRLADEHSQITISFFRLINFYLVSIAQQHMTEIRQEEGEEINGIFLLLLNSIKRKKEIYYFILSSYHLVSFLGQFTLKLF